LKSDINAEGSLCSTLARFTVLSHDSTPPLQFFKAQVKLHVHTFYLRFEFFIDLFGIWTQFKIDFHFPFVVYVARVHLALDRTPRHIMYAAFSVALLVRTRVKEPYAFKLESVAFKILHFPLFTRVKTSPK